MSVMDFTGRIFSEILMWKTESHTDFVGQCKHECWPLDSSSRYLKEHDCSVLSGSACRD